MPWKDHAIPKPPCPACGCLGFLSPEWGPTRRGVYAAYVVCETDQGLGCGWRSPIYDIPKGVGPRARSVEAVLRFVEAMDCVWERVAAIPKEVPA